MFNPGFKSCDMMAGAKAQPVIQRWNITILLAKVCSKFFGEPTAVLFQNTPADSHSQIAVQCH